jgi:hypothetical protein
MNKPEGKYVNYNASQTIYIIGKPELDLQIEIERHYKLGFRKFILKGEFTVSNNKKSLLELSKKRGFDDDRIIISSNGINKAKLNGEGKVMHVIFVGGGLKNISFIGLDIFGGTTADKSIWNECIKEGQGYKRESIFQFIDGSGVMITGNSSAEFIDCDIHNNESIMCGGGVSIQQSSDSNKPVTFLNCRIFNNVSGDTGGGIDVLTPGSWVIVNNCIIKENISNKHFPSENRNGQITLFADTFSEIIHNRFSSINNTSAVDYSKKAYFVMKNNIVKSDLDTNDRIKQNRSPSLIYRIIHLKYMLSPVFYYFNYAYSWITKGEKIYIEKKRLDFIDKFGGNQIIKD